MYIFILASMMSNDATFDIMIKPFSQETRPKSLLDATCSVSSV